MQDTRHRTQDAGGTENAEGEKGGVREDKYVIFT